MKKIANLYIVVFVFLILLIYRNWLTFNPLSSGDWTYRHIESFQYYSLIPKIWSINFGGGLGGSVPYILGLDAYYFITGKVLSNFAPWVIIERAIWYWPFLILSFFSSYLFSKKILGEKFAYIAPFIFSLNTYSILLVAGGQMGVALAYVIAPLVLFCLFNFLLTLSGKSVQTILIKGLLYGLALSFQMILDPRLTYVTLFASLFIIPTVLQKKHLKKVFYFVIPVSVVASINLFWLLPLYFFPQSIDNLGSQYTSSDALSFFSFAKLENSISLLHPNWPENIFGKVSFLNPLFLVMPILAFSGLAFINKDKKKKFILIFAWIGLLGIFLAKGVNAPFGEIYRVLFEKIPGFVMFRDPTKWYLLIALSYSILIPFSLNSIVELANKKIGKKIGIIFHLIFLLLVSIMIYEALINNMYGTLKSREIPQEYLELKESIRKEKGYFRTLYVPTKQRYAYHGFDKPALGADEILKSTSVERISKELLANEELIRDSAIKYVVVPSDPLGEIFLDDRKYSNSVRVKYIEALDSIPWLERINFNGNSAIYKLSSPKQHFWAGEGRVKVNHQFISPTKYTIEITNAKKGDKIVFAERYDMSWFAKVIGTQESGQPIRSMPYNLLNSFTIPEGSYTLEVYFMPQKYVEIGLLVGVIVFGTIVGGLIYLNYRR